MAAPVDNPAPAPDGPGSMEAWNGTGAGNAGQLGASAPGRA